MGLGAAYGFGYLLAILASLQPPAVYSKDFVQEFLLARAFVDPTHPDPYAPIRELAERYLVVVGYAVKEYPTPHPPTIGVLFSPLTLVDYSTAAAIWLAVQLASLVAAISILARAHGKHLQLTWLVALALLAIGWHPVHLDLGLGQLMIVVLALLAGARLALLRGRFWLAGALVGIAILVKVIAWPLVILLALRRTWQAVAACCATVIAGCLLVGLTSGFGTLIDYAGRVAPLLTSYFRSDPANQSLWTLGPRLARVFGFDDFTGPILIVASALAPAVVLVGVLAWSHHRLNFDAAFGVVLCVSLVLSPIAWEMYLVVALIPAVQIGGLLTLRHSSPPIVLVSLGSVLLLLVEWDQWVALQQMIDWAPGSALLSLGPAFAVLLVGWSLALLAKHNNAAPLTTPASMGV